MDLRELLTLGRRWAWLLVGGTIIAAGAAFAAHSTLSPQQRYDAQAVVLVGPALSANADSGELEAARRVAAIYARLAVSRPLLDRISSAIDGAISSEDLEDLVAADTPGDPPIITISATAATPSLAVEVANGLLAELQAAAPSLAGPEGQTRRFLEEQTEAIELEINTVVPAIAALEADPSRTPIEEQRLETLQTRLTSLRATYASLVADLSSGGPGLLTVVEEATVDAVRPSSARLLTTILAGLFGFTLAAVAAMLSEKLDDTLRTEDDVRRTTGFRNLGEIVRIPRRATRGRTGVALLAAPRSTFSESIRSARINIEFAAPDPFHSLLITSARRRDGRTMVATNLAVAFARAGRRVLLVDADLHQPSVHRQFGLMNRHGLSDLLLSPESPSASAIQESGLPGLMVLTTGIPPRADAELAGLFEMKELIDRLAGETDALIVVDSPPVLAFSETAVLASQADAIVLVVGAGRTSLRDLHAARDALLKAKPRVIGTIVNRVPKRQSWRQPDETRRPTRDQAIAPWLREDHPNP